MKRRPSHFARGRRVDRVDGVAAMAPMPSDVAATTQRRWRRDESAAAALCTAGLAPPEAASGGGQAEWPDCLLLGDQAGKRHDVKLAAPLSMCTTPPLTRYSPAACGHGGGQREDNGQRST